MDNEDDDEEACPLCMQPLDETDLSFFACPCNYQICLFCVHYIIEQMNGKCPACRTDYAEEAFRYDAARAKSYRERKADKRKATDKDRDKGSHQTHDDKPHQEQERDLRARHAEQLRQRRGRGGRRDLSEVRVVQRNVVHVIGLSVNIAKAEVLRRPEFFGQYGKLTRVTVSKAPTQAKISGNSNGTPLYSAYLAFERAEDAGVAIQAVDGFSVDGHILRASCGTTKYCRKFLEGEKCERKDCNFLHRLVEDDGHGGKGSSGGGKGGHRDKGGKDGGRDRERHRDKHHTERDGGGRDHHHDGKGASTSATATGPGSTLDGGGKAKTQERSPKKKPKSVTMGEGQHANGARTPEESKGRKGAAVTPHGGHGKGAGSGQNHTTSQGNTNSQNKAATGSSPTKGSATANKPQRGTRAGSGSGSGAPSQQQQTSGAIQQQAVVLEDVPTNESAPSSPVKVEHRPRQQGDAADDDPAQQLSLRPPPGLLSGESEQPPGAAPGSTPPTAPPTTLPPMASAPAPTSAPGKAPPTSAPKMPPGNAPPSSPPQQQQWGDPPKRPPAAMPTQASAAPKLPGPLPAGPPPQGAPPAITPQLPAPPLAPPPPVSTAPIEMAAMIGFLPAQDEVVCTPSHHDLQADKVAYPSTQTACQPPAAPPMHPPSQPPLQPPAAAAGIWQQQQPPTRPAPPAAAPPSAEPPVQPPMQPPSQPPGQPPRGPPTQPPPQGGPRPVGHTLMGSPQAESSLMLPASLPLSAQMDLPGNSPRTGPPQETSRTPATAPPRAPPSAPPTMPPRAPPSAPPSLPPPTFSAPTGPPASAVAGAPGIQHSISPSPPGIINGMAVESNPSGLPQTTTSFGAPLGFVDGSVVSTAPPTSPQGSGSPAGMQDFQCRHPSSEAPQLASAAGPAATAATVTAGVQLPVPDALFSAGNLFNLSGCSSVADLLPPAPLAPPTAAAAAVAAAAAAAGNSAAAAAAAAGSSSSLAPTLPPPPTALQVGHQLPQPRRAYDLAAAAAAAAVAAAAPPAAASTVPPVAAPTESIRSPACDATRSAFTAAAFDQPNPFMSPLPSAPGVLDPSSFNAYDGHQFDTALYQAAYEAALYGAADMPGLPRHPYPFAPQVHTTPWVPTLGLSSEATAPPAAAPTAPASVSDGVGGNRKPRRDAQGGGGGVLAGGACVAQQETLMQAPTAPVSREEGVEILQALLPNTRISVRPAVAATAATATAPMWCPVAQVAAPDKSGRRT